MIVETERRGHEPLRIWTPPGLRRLARLARTGATIAALGLAISACLVTGKAVLNGRVAPVPLPPHSQLAVQVCEKAIPDCDRWFYPDAAGRFQAPELDPGRYTVTAFLEEPGGLTPLASVEAVLLGGQTATVEVVVPALPSIPPA